MIQRRLLSFICKYCLIASWMHVLGFRKNQSEEYKEDVENGIFIISLYRNNINYFFLVCIKMQTLIMQELGINAKWPVQNDVTETRSFKNWAEISSFLTENLKLFFFLINHGHSRSRNGNQETACWKSNIPPWLFSYTIFLFSELDLHLLIA